MKIDVPFYIKKGGQGIYTFFCLHLQETLETKEKLISATGRGWGGRGVDGVRHL